MGTILHKGNNTEVKSSILQAAQKRFGLFGFEKTSMNEIALDIGMTKGSIYYYYSDKEELYGAVVKIEQDEFLNDLNDKIIQIEDPEKMLMEYIEMRLMYFRKLLNLGRFRLEEFAGMKSFLFDSVTYFKARELEFICQIFKIGIDKGVFFIEDTEAIASLFLDILKGLRISLMSNKNIFYLEQVEYDSIKKKSEQFTEFFLKGLKCRQ